MNKNNYFPKNEHLKKIIRDRQQTLRFHPEDLYEWWRPQCTIRILLVADGFLNFGSRDFGLSAFVSTLVNESYSYGKFEITLAHRGSSVGNPEVSIERSIADFKFSNTNHFDQDMYDQVWLFGSSGEFSNTSGIGVRMSPNELTALETFMDNGGGVFATGDHGALGKTLCGNIKRVNQMRRWDNTSGEVGMFDSKRNDTNQIGREPGSQFDDQSDDIPQYIHTKKYTSQLGIFLFETYPHPLLCGRNGPINYIPDHPHEGECVVPNDLSDFPGSVIPEIIATSLVSGGKTSSGSKLPTIPHSFGAICAYDGHQVNVGRVVTDATWHHFINVNLIGEINDSQQDNNRGTTEHPSKLEGFLYSTSGEQYLAQIKEYYINIALWIARKNNQICINAGGLWKLLFQHRVLETSMDHPSLALERISPALLYSIGTHARDVLGKLAGQCRKIQIINDGIRTSAPEFADVIDPYISSNRSSDKLPIPWFDYKAIISMALGGGMLAMRDQYMYNDRDENKKVSSNEVMKVFHAGVKKGLSVAFKTVKSDMKELDKFLEVAE